MLDLMCDMRISGFSKPCPRKSQWEWVRYQRPQRLPIIKDPIKVCTSCRDAITAANGGSMVGTWIAIEGEKK